MSTTVAPLMTLEALRSVPLFGSLDDAAARELRSLLRVVEAPNGSVLFNHGDTGDAMYLIESGRVRIHVLDSTGHDVTLAELAGGDFFGEMALLDGKSRSADATVVESARLAILSRQDFLSFVRRNPDVALEMLSAITDRLRRTDELLRQRVSRNVNEEAAARMTLSDRMADIFSNFAGSWTFFIASLCLILVWVLLNAWLLGNGQFDAYPYNLLDLVFGIVAGLQAPIILMAQNRQSNQDRLRADIDFQINLKNELSLAEVLRRLDVLESERLPILFKEQNERVASALRPAPDGE
jgi:CRP/FNR family transcriptional regulator, cyclic AMP receptor protein